MASLENTIWKLTLDGVQPSVYSATINFGPNTAPPGNCGGEGTMVDADGSTPIVWSQNYGQFMFQLQNQDSGYSTLTTYSGSITSGTANGWSTNFLVNFSKQGFEMKLN